jgi:hypothetical protein
MVRTSHREGPPPGLFPATGPQVSGRPVRQSPEERQAQVADDLRRLTGFLTALISEARHLKLPVPSNAPEIVDSRYAWLDQLRDASE